MFGALCRLIEKFFSNNSVLSVIVSRTGVPRGARLQRRDVAVSVETHDSTTTLFYMGGASGDNTAFRIHSSNILY